MSNLINFREKTCQCSNGCTDVLLTVIGLSGSLLLTFKRTCCPVVS